MIDGLKQYPGLRDSSASWIGQVPSHWAVSPNRAIFREVNDRNHPSEDMLSVTITRGIVRQLDLLADTSKKDTSNLDKSNYKLVQPADIAYNKMRAWQGAIAASKLRGIISPAYVVMRLHDSRQLPQYFHYLYRTTAFANEAERWSYGITSDMWSLRPEHFRAIRSPLPPIDEQRAIVRFLDYADRRIRKYIAAKRKLIALLEEQKRAIIDRAVTRGLDPNVRLKDSGAPWIGRVPEHWAVQRCRYLFREIDRRSIDGSEQHLSMSQRLGLVPGEMVDKSLVSESYAGGKLCEVGDLVLNRLKAHLGVFAMASTSGVISPDYTVLRPLKSEGASYFEHVLKSQVCRHELRVRAKGIVEGFWRLYTDDFYDIRVPVPPPIERRQIVDWARSVAESANRAINCAEREISSLVEFRSRLVSDVVTGKLDVREAAARLPDESRGELGAEVPLGYTEAADADEVNNEDSAA